MRVKPIHVRLCRGFGLFLLLLGMMAPYLPAFEAPANYKSESAANAGFDRLYNLDYDRAIQTFTQDLKKSPNDPMAVNHLLTAVLFKELYRMGVLTTGDYANDSFLSVT
ncbi:MAG: hypothetical protein H0X25_06925, partial [Acidobacteriales bacterium]|nr:hypothetical protein [Terriglobales bacterium]